MTKLIAQFLASTMNNRNRLVLTTRTVGSIRRSVKPDNQCNRLGMTTRLNETLFKETLFLSTSLLGSTLTGCPWSWNRRSPCEKWVVFLQKKNFITATSSSATLDYIRDDETLFPKVGVVTIAGLGGLLLGHRGGALRKTFYSSVAAAVALSVCYPKQSSNLLDQVYLRIKNESRALIDSKSWDVFLLSSLSEWLSFARDRFKSLITLIRDSWEENRREQRSYSPCSENRAWPRHHHPRRLRTRYTCWSTSVHNTGYGESSCRQYRKETLNFSYPWKRSWTLF